MSIGSFHFENIQVFTFEIQCLGRKKKKKFKNSVGNAVILSQMTRMNGGKERPYGETCGR